MADVPPTQSFPQRHTPYPDFAVGSPWLWDYWKFDFEKPDVLFTTLHAEYNTMRCSFQDPVAWHSDVRDVASTAKNHEEFLALLEQRRNDRFDEIRKAWRLIKAKLVGQPSHWENPPSDDVLCDGFINVSRNFSFDSLVAYFGSYVADDDDRRNVPLPPIPAEESPKQQKRRTTAARATPPIPVEASPKQRKRKATTARATPPRRTTTRSSGISKTRPQPGDQNIRRSARLQQRTAAGPRAGVQ